MNLLTLHSLLIRLFLFFVLASQTVGAVNFTKDEKKWIAAHPKVTLGSDYSWAPYDFVDDTGKHVGIAADILALVSQKTGIGFDVKTGVWADILQKMKEGKLDGLSCAVSTTKREAYLHFSPPYMGLPLVIVVQDRRDDIKTITDLNGKLIAVNKGSYLHEWLLEKHPKIRLKLVSSNNAALEEVAYSKVDAYIGNIAVVSYIIKTHYLSNVKIVGAVDYMSTNVSIAIDKNNTILQQIIDKSLQDISQKEKEEIQDKWIAFKFEKTVDHTLLYIILGVFAIFILVSLLWYRKLRYEVKKRQESEAQMSMLIDNIPLNVIVSDFDGKVLRTNHFALETFNIKYEDIFSHNVMEFYVESTQRDEILKLIQSEGKVANQIVKFKRPDETTMDVMLSIIPMMYDGQKALLSIMVDLTQRIEMEERLRTAKKMADNANKAKSEFLANMSHEIRTPMNAIMGFTELLNEHVKEPRLKSYTKVIQNAGKSLLTLINDILDLSKIEAGKLEIRKTAVDVHSIVNDVASIFSMAVAKKGLSIVLDIDEEIPKSLRIDGIRLRQVLVNLVGNAVKFTQEGYIKISVHALNVDEHHSKLDLEISVEDTGIGIPEAQRENIFNSFEQQEGQDNRKFGGTGLGLSISKRLVEMMDGSILVQSVEEKGATFFVYLYGVDISTIQLNEIENTDEKIDIRFHPAKVMVVDDIEDNRELIVTNFEETAIEIVTASDGLEAIEQYKKEKPDLILMDIRMPNMDGYEATKQIRAISDVPIIALTASIMADEYEQTKGHSFSEYLRKPVLKKDLFLALSHFLEYEKVKILEETVDKQALVLGDSAMQNIGEVQVTLKTNILPLYEKALGSNSIVDIKTFSEKVDKLAEKYKITPLKEYVHKLNTAIDSFDIVQIQVLLKVFEHLSEEMNSF